MPEKGVDGFGKKTPVAGTKFFAIVVEEAAKPAVGRHRVVLNLDPNLGRGL